MPPSASNSVPRRKTLERVWHGRPPSGWRTARVPVESLVRPVSVMELLDELGKQAFGMVLVENNRVVAQLAADNGVHMSGAPG